jgi:hypothetical protein
LKKSRTRRSDPQIAQMTQKDIAGEGRDTEKDGLQRRTVYESHEKSEISRMDFLSIDLRHSNEVQMLSEQAGSRNKGEN